MGETTEHLRRLIVAQQVIASALAELSPSPELFDRLLSTVCATLDWSFGAAWLRDREADVLAPAAVWNASDRPGVGAYAAATLEQRFARGRALPGYVWSTGTPAWLQDIGWDPRMTSTRGAEEAQLRSAVAVPLGTGEACEGVLEFHAEQHREQDAEQLLWLSVVGAQVAQYLARWRTWETLARRERALAAAVNGVVIADATKPGFPITYVNPGFERLTGWSMEDILGQPCSVLRHPESDPAATEELREALATGREARVTVLNRRRDGEAFWNEVCLSPVTDDTGRVIEYIGVQSDVTDTREAQERAEFLAYHDALTGLPNRALLARVLAGAESRTRRHGVQAALAWVDLDGFKAINDAHGHAVGDHVLDHAAKRLSAVVRANDLLVRQGGDEFVLLMPDLDPAVATSAALDAAERLRVALADPFVLEDGTRIRLRGSIGVSLLGGDAADADTLLRHADTAMYRAKRTARGSVRLYRETGSAPGAIAAPGGAQVPASADELAELDRLLREDAVRAVYQPIVDLDTREPVAYEALARGPETSPLAMPDRLFAAARHAGRLGELDWACRAAAARGALAAGLGGSRRLFVNVEPETLATPCPDHLAAVWARAGRELDVVVEVTERALTARPADLLHLLERARENGWSIALDDVGADVRSLALMPLVQPEVIKLDLRLVQDRPSTDVAEIVNAVNAEKERTGALLLAEGIETEAHLATARAMGATLGQGWLFARPAPLDPPAAPPAAPPVFPQRPGTDDEVSPYAVVARERAIRRADKRLLLSISLQLEQQAAALGETAVIVSAFQDASRFTPLTAKRYTLLGADAALVAALGADMVAEPAPGVRGADLGPDDPLLGEWSVVVLGPHFAAALVAIDLGDTGPDMRREFDFALTYDRDLVIRAASALLRRVQPITPAG